jgi:PhoPQ-activated pathogenicity-related protein
MIDPYSYRGRLTEPKLVVLGTNDDYTPTDSLNQYWDGLAGPKAVLYLPNTEHVGTNYHPDVNPTAFAFARAVASRTEMPKMEWQLEVSDGRAAFRVRTNEVANFARLWTSTAATRDFRSSQWNSTAMRRIPETGIEFPQSLVGEISLPETGFTAILGEIEFAGGGVPYRLSTQVQVVASRAAARSAR